MPISLSASSRSLCPSVFIVFIPHIPYNYTVALEKLGLHSLHKRRYYLEALFFVHVYHGFKSGTSLIENVTLHIPPSNLWEFSLFRACPSNKHRPSAQCAYAANVVGKDLDIFALGTISLNCIYTRNLLLSLLLCYNFLCYNSDLYYYYYYYYYY
jgi:hypothetical protein